jgi:hypothetical protein
LPPVLRPSARARAVAPHRSSWPRSLANAESVGGCRGHASGRHRHVGLDSDPFPFFFRSWGPLLGCRRGRARTRGPPRGRRCCGRPPAVRSPTRVARWRFVQHEGEVLAGHDAVPRLVRMKSRDIRSLGAGTFRHGIPHDGIAGRAGW